MECLKITIILLLCSIANCETDSDCNLTFKEKVLLKRQKRLENDRLRTEFQANTVKSIEEKCGAICDTSQDPKSEGTLFGFLRKEFHCDNLFDSIDLTEVAKYQDHPAKVLPQFLINNFTYGGRLKLRK